ncbi:MAG: RsmE family RNA methyltransferase [Actinomycetota bacterium]
MRYASDVSAVAHVFVDGLDEECIVAGADGHHLARVRRLRIGERVTAADGAGSWREYDVARVESGRIVLAARGEIEKEPQLEPPISLAVALVKGGLDDVVARCTELGVERIEPLQTARTIVRWDEVRAAHAWARLRSVAREAASQCRRARLPEIAPLTTLADLIDRPGVLVAERRGRAAATLGPAPAIGWTVVIGPEGGFAPDELAPLGPVPRLAVGPHVLRAATAPVAALASLRGCGAV